MNGETILCVAPRCWHRLWKDTQSIMSRLARDNRVLYFEPGRDGEASFTREFIRNFPNFIRLSPIEIDDNLVIIPTPSTLPHARRIFPKAVLARTVPLTHQLNARSIALQIHRAVKHYHVEKPILWLYGLFSVDLIGQFGEKLTCYTNYDDFGGFPQNARIHDVIEKLDVRLSSEVDVIFATSRTQTEIHRAINPNTYFIPNAVDYDLFHHTLDSDSPIPADLAGIAHPMIGYVGRMAAQINVPLLRKAAETYPQYSFVFVGPDHLPASIDSQVLHALPNTHFVGQKLPTELPAYLRQFKVVLIPYSLTARHVLSGYPTKLHEYLAAGRTVVATAMPELEPFSHVVHIGSNDDAFIRLIPEALADQSPEALDARLAVAKANTWDNRVTEIHGILDKYLA